MLVLKFPSTPFSRVHPLFLFTDGAVATCNTVCHSTLSCKTRKVTQPTQHCMTRCVATRCQQCQVSTEIIQFFKKRKTVWTFRTRRPCYTLFLTFDQILTLVTDCSDFALQDVRHFYFTDSRVQRRRGGGASMDRKLASRLVSAPLRARLFGVHSPPAAFMWPIVTLHFQQQSWNA